MFNFDWMIGQEYDFYGVDNHKFKLGIGNSTIVLEAIEDAEDHYRSYLKTVKSVQEENDIFYKKPFAKVKIVKIDEPDFDGYLLIDKNNHVWLRVGTEDHNTYYPTFIFGYTPFESLT